MADKLVEFLFGIFGNDFVTVALISAFPLIELKGAIPIGLKAGLSLLQSAALSYVGSSLVCIPLYFLLLPVFGLLKKIGAVGKFFGKVENMLYLKASDFAAKAEKGKIGGGLSVEEKKKKADRLIFAALFAFVAIPLPMTGVWTGTAIAVFLHIDFGRAFVALVGGNFVAGALITLLTLIFKDKIDYVIYALFIVFIVMLIVMIIKIARAPSVETESSKTESDGKTKE